MRCVECGYRGEVAVRYEDMPHDTLPNVTLRGIEIRTCPQCAEEYIVYPRFAQLRAAIRDVIVRKRGPLAPEEFKFLRKFLGWSSQDTARRMGVDPSSVSRWENGKRAIGPTTDRLIRALAMLEEPTERYEPEAFEFGTEEAPPTSGIEIELKGSRWAVAC